MQEVVKNEVLKLLDDNIIYPISDSKWVSPIHVVPKKYEYVLSALIHLFLLVFLALVLYNGTFELISGKIGFKAWNEHLVRKYSEMEAEVTTF